MFITLFKSFIKGAGDFFHYVDLDIFKRKKEKKMLIDRHVNSTTKKIYFLIINFASQLCNELKINESNQKPKNKVYFYRLIILG